MTDHHPAFLRRWRATARQESKPPAEIVEALMRVDLAERWSCTDCGMEQDRECPTCAECGGRVVDLSYREEPMEMYADEPMPSTDVDLPDTRSWGRPAEPIASWRVRSLVP